MLPSLTFRLWHEGTARWRCAPHGGERLRRGVLRVAVGTATRTVLITVSVLLRQTLPRRICRALLGRWFRSGGRHSFLFQRSTGPGSEVCVHRRRLSVDFEARHRCATFMRLAEERLRQQLNRVVHIHVFAPAPELVMKLELRASAQLLPKLVGILSARGCGLRLALRARYGSPRSLQVFTAVTKPDMHANELRTVLEVAGFPRSLCGVFVFTSDRSQRAAEAAGLTSGIFSTEDAVAALARRASLLDHEGVAPELLAEFLQWSLQSDAQLLLPRLCGRLASAWSRPKTDRWLAARQQPGSSAWRPLFLVTRRSARKAVGGFL